jgi:hypothetical protein
MVYAWRPGSVALAVTVWVAVVVLGGCGKHAAPGDAGASPGASSGPGSDVREDAEAMDGREAAQWEAARGGEPEELMRLADLVGCDGLRERAGRVDLRTTAVAAMRYCEDFSELPWLGRLALEGNDADARAALDTIVDQSSRPRRSTDPEDADDLHSGCETLLALARDVARPRDRRVLAIRSLRMLSERGCVKRGDIPGDLDAR